MVFSGPAVASPDDGFALSDDAAIMGGAVVASGRDAASGWYNPALLGSNDRLRIDVHATAYGLRLARANAGVREQVGEQHRALRLSDRQLFVIPTAFAVASAVSRRVSVGFGVFTPAYAETQALVDGRGRNATAGYDYTHLVRVAGLTRRYHLGPLVAWRPTDALAIGLAVNAIYDKRTVSDQVFADATALEGPEQRTISAIEDSGLRSFGGEVVLGVRGQLGRWVSAGATLRSPGFVIVQFVDGSESTVEAATDGDGVSQGDADLGTDPVRVRPSRLTPWQVAVGVAVGNERWTVELDADAAARVEAREPTWRRKPVWNVRVGACVQLSPRWLAGAGLFTDRSYRVAADFPDFDVNLWGGSLGAQLRTPVRLARRERARSLAFRTTVAVRYAGGRGETGQLAIRYPDGGPLDFGLDRNATTSGHMHLLTLHIGTGLTF